MRRSRQSRDSILDELVRSMPITDETFPAIQFFQPRAKFLRFMKKYAGDRLVYDVGAGCGHVSRKLRDVGVKAIPMDLAMREHVECSVLLANGAQFKYESGTVVMLARPCHGPFAQAVVRQAEKCGVDAVLYIGFDKNIREYITNNSFAVLMRNAGENYEEVFEILL